MPSCTGRSNFVNTVINSADRLRNTRHRSDSHITPLAVRCHNFFFLAEITGQPCLNFPSQPQVSRTWNTVGLAIR